MTNKREYYEHLLDRLDKAIAEEFFLEATWLAYSVIEDRIESVLNDTGGVPGRALFGAKLGELISRKTANGAIQKAFFDDLLDRINVWKDKRNSLMHALADTVQTPEDFKVECKEIAEVGKELARDMCSAIYRYKKHK